MASYSADIVEGGYNLFSGNGNKKKHQHTKELLLKDRNSDLIIFGTPWGKVFRAQLFESICFPEGYWFEDTIMHFLVYPLAEKILLIDDIVYFYRRNLAGISYSSTTKIKSLDSYWITERVLKDRLLLGLENKTLLLYDLLLNQLVMNFRRILFVKEKNVKRYTYILSANLLNKYFGTNPGLKQNEVEYLLRNGNYMLWYVYCFFSVGKK